MVDMGALQVTSSNVHGQLVQLLKQHLQSKGVKIVDSAAQADYLLSVSAERNSRRAIATTSDISVAEYEIRQQVNVTLQTADATPLVSSVTVFAERTYTFDRQSLEGSSEEEALLRSEMRVDLVQQIMRRVAVIIGRAANGRAANGRATNGRATVDPIGLAADQVAQ